MPEERGVIEAPARVIAGLVRLGTYWAQPWAYGLMWGGLDVTDWVSLESSAKIGSVMALVGFVVSGLACLAVQFWPTDNDGMLDSVSGDLSALHYGWRWFWLRFVSFALLLGWCAIPQMDDVVWVTGAVGLHGAVVGFTCVEAYTLVTGRYVPR